MIKGFQRLLQRLFVRVEALFNRAFGDRLNPLYRLGAISFFLFWVICGTGLYLYAFFETGVSAAFSSVEALTHGQWWAGGILRSVHRYASDAFVFTMLLHMVRHFAFDRFRGFRWFSWITGVALIWLVYASGINGYMLPWDKMGQFVITASFEWIDWLPMFGGTLMRNFMYASSVNDRFFSLLSFMHIGIPLLVLLLMWVHVQRVPKARTNPPGTIMACLVLTLVALSVAVPALSQGGAADMAVSPGALQFDWFLLAMLPLVYLWPPSALWAFAAIATALLAALPWLPPGRRRQRKEFSVEVHADAFVRTLAVRAGETLLDSGLREGMALPYECRNGGCGVCMCTVLQGDVDRGIYQSDALPDSLRSQGRALMCCATPLSDLAIEVALAGDAQPLLRRIARVDHIERLAPEMIRLTLSLPGGKHLEFAAGQYLNFVLDDGQRRAFSFANPPHRNEHIDLHVRLIPGGRFTTHVFTQLKVGDELAFEGPLGSFMLRESPRPILFVAGATGFAPVKSILEDAFHRGVRRPMWLYWGVRRRHDLYLLELALEWQREHPNFHFVPVLSHATPEDQWTGRTGLVHQAILADFPDLAGSEVYVCGSVKMVEAAVPAFIAQGLPDDACFSDAFVPAPRLQAPA